MLLRSVALGDGSVVHAAFSLRQDGDFALDPEGDFVVGPAPPGVGPSGAYTWLRQVHGATVVIVDAPGEQCGAPADAAVTSCMDAPLTIRTADCAPIAIYSSNGVLGAVHAGWHGLVVGVVAECADAMRALGALDLRAIVGPCIHAECYEFGRDDLASVIAVVGDRAVGVTRDGAVAMDLPAAVASALQRAGVEVADRIDQCTACCSQEYFSHRARAERERHVMVLWRAQASR
ncbi:MAG TPA: polyphenol oxidase family protein [Acidimicrobiales bacterium]|nr:polyphenol oxidase family protein [Acidimicrobiales bacterium]